MGFIINTAVQRSELRTILFNDRCRCALSQQRPQGASTEPPREPGAAKCAKLLCPGCRAWVPPSTADDYAAAPPFIRAASHCVGFVKGYHSMWLQPAEHRTQPATAPVKACGKKVCRLSPPLHPPLLGSLANHGAHSHEPSGTGAAGEVLTPCAVAAHDHSIP